MSFPSHPPTPRRAFTLVELLVVIGIIALLMSILLPVVSKARKQANSTKCKAQLHDLGHQLLLYANSNRGWLYPPDLGAASTAEQRWPVLVVYPFKWNPKLMLCPSDERPADEHSYLLNDHIAVKKIKYGYTKFKFRSVSDVVVLGEKKSSEVDYYMNPPGDFTRVVELQRHGPSLGSNYLHLDMSVNANKPELVQGATDPWDPTPN